MTYFDKFKNLKDRTRASIFVQSEIDLAEYRTYYYTLDGYCSENYNNAVAHSEDIIRKMPVPPEKMRAWDLAHLLVDIGKYYDIFIPRYMLFDNTEVTSRKKAVRKTLNLLFSEYDKNSEFWW